MRDLRLVLRTQLRVLGKKFRVKRWQGVLGLIPGLALVGGIGYGLGFGASQVFVFLGGALVDQPALREVVEVNTLALYALGTAVMVLVSAFGSVQAAIYESADNAFLFSTPLSVSAVLAARMIEVCLNHLLWAGPAMIGPVVAYGLVRSAPAAFYSAVALGQCAYVVTIIAVAALVVTVVMRFVPGPRLKRLTTVVVFLCLLALMFSMNLVVFNLKIGGGPVPFLQRLADLRVGSLEIFPHVWLARVAVNAAAGRAPGLPLAALLFAAGGLCAVLLALAPRLYLLGWGSSQEAVSKRNSREAWAKYAACARRRATQPKATLFAALLRKELKISSRSPTYWYLLGVGFISVGFILTQRVTRLAGQQPSSGNVAVLFGMLLAGSALSSLVFAGTSLSREGAMLPLWLAFPNRPRTVYLSKVAAGLPLPFALVGIGLGLFSRLLPQWSFAMYLLPAVCILVAVVSMIVAVDTLTPKFQIDQGLMQGSGSGPQSVGKILASYLGLIGIGLCTAVFNFPSYYQRLSWAAVLTPGQAVLVGWGGLILVTSLVTYGSYRLGAAALNRLLLQGGGAEQL